MSNNSKSMAIYYKTYIATRPAQMKKIKTWKLST